MIWHNDDKLPKSDLIVLPGGFSYGDYLKMWKYCSKSKIIKSVIDFAELEDWLLVFVMDFKY